MIQSLRAIEFAVGVALLQVPDKIYELLETLGCKIPDVHGAKGVAQVLG